MKKILIFLLCLAMLGCGTLAEAAEKAAPGAQLGFEMLNELYVPGENRVISPQSLALALGMAAEGAGGETLHEILAALDAESADEIYAELPEGLKSANAVFTAPMLNLLPEYIAALNDGYAAEWFEMDENVVEKVNAWVYEHTDELIDRLLSDAPDADAGMILINAVAMDGCWENVFAPEATVEDVFHAPDGDVDVLMMHQTESFDYAEKDGMQIIRLPYSTGSLEMWIALPPEGGMAQLLEILANEGMFYLKSDAENRKVNLSLPKLDITDENTLDDALKLLGVQTAFTDSADFSGISDTPLCIDSILQKARIQLDENGTKAAAATALIMRALSMREEQQPVQLRVDRPFVFVISDGETGSVCFAGVVENPAKN